METVGDPKETVGGPEKATWCVEAVAGYECKFEGVINVAEGVKAVEEFTGGTVAAEGGCEEVAGGKPEGVNDPTGVVDDLMLGLDGLRLS